MFSGVGESWSFEQDKDCRRRPETEVRHHKSARPEASVLMNVQIKTCVYGLQEKLESIVGGVGWEQSGFLQRS